MITQGTIWKKVLLTTLVLGILLAPQLNLAVFAQATQINFTPTESHGACSAWPGDWPACFLEKLTYVLGLAISLGAWAITLGLQMNQDLAYTTTVQSGFGITLAVANLGFVFAIILIAIATIIGYESYGVKKNLWRLVVAALLVNFSLVICSFIIGFFDQFAYYFARQMGSGQSDLSGVSLQLANSFQLNRLATWTQVAAFFPTLAFIVMFQTIITFTFFAVAFSLIARYIFLAILMILMPIAWLAWIIPGYQKHWHTWWENFMKWVLSPTILLTFLYIAVAITTAANTPNGEISKWAAGIQGGTGAIVDQAAGGGGLSLTDTILRMVVGLALVWGALITANSMGARGASAAMSWSKTAGKKAQYYGSKWSRRAARRGYNAYGFGDKVTKGLQGTGLGRGGVLRMLTIPLRYAGRGLEAATLQGTEKLISEGKKLSEGLTLDQKINNFSTADRPTQIAWLEEIKEKGRVHEIKNIEQYLGKDRGDAEKKKEAFIRYGKEKLFNDARNESGLHLIQLSKELNGAMQSNNTAAATDAQKEIEKYFKGAPGVGFLAETFFQDFDKLKLKGKNLPFSIDPTTTEGKETLNLTRQAMAIAAAKQFSPTNMSEFFKKLTKGDQLEMFKGVAESLNNNQGLKEGNFEKRNWNWLNGNAARGMGISPEIFGLSGSSPTNTPSNPPDNPNHQGVI